MRESGNVRKKEKDEILLLQKTTKRMIVWRERERGREKTKEKEERKFCSRRGREGRVCSQKEREIDR